MLLHVNAQDPAQVEADWLIATVAEEEEFHPPLQAIDAALGGALTRLKESGDLTGKAGELVKLPDAPGLAATRVLLVGLGKIASLNRTQFEKGAMSAIRAVTDKSQRTAAIVLNSSATDSVTLLMQAEIWATSAVVGGRGQALYKAEADRFPLKDVTLVVESDVVVAEVRDAAAKGRVLGDAVNVTRDLVNRTPDDMYPEVFAERARQVADEFEHVTCEIWDEGRLVDEKMNSLLAVARGSDRPPRLVVLEYLQGGPNAPTIALVGKGVTFDSGGYSLKPTDSMTTMKCDMAGAATVLGAVSAIAELNLKVNVVGLMGLVENLISGSAYKLGDILTARNGTTIEVLNTDAEGRLVLADVLCYAADRGVDHIIDLATLTGACVVALGEDVTGAFTNDQAWCDRVLAAASTVGEHVWQLPTWDFFNDLLKSDVADCKNVGGRWGGAITAAKFLEKFVNGISWVHLDIAGPAFASAGKPHREGGGTGTMVRTLVEAVRQRK